MGWEERMRVFFTLTQMILCFISLENKVSCVPAATERENGKNFEWLFHHDFHLNWCRALLPLDAEIREALMAYVREPLSYRKLSYIKAKLDIFMGVKQFLSNLCSHPWLAFSNFFKKLVTLLFPDIQHLIKDWMCPHTDLEGSKESWLWILLHNPDYRPSMTTYPRLWCTIAFGNSRVSKLSWVIFWGRIF